MRLENCHKCGSTNIDVDTEPGIPEFYYVCCSSVTCGLTTINFPTKQEAIENWNEWNKAKKYQKITK